MNELRKYELEKETRAIAYSIYLRTYKHKMPHVEDHFDKCKEMAKWIVESTPIPDFN